MSKPEGFVVRVKEGRQEIGSHGVNPDLPAMTKEQAEALAKQQAGTVSVESIGEVKYVDKS